MDDEVTQLIDDIQIGTTNYLPLSSGTDEDSYNSFSYTGVETQLLPDGIKIKKLNNGVGARSFMVKKIKVEEKDLPENTPLVLSMEISNELNIATNSNYFIRWFLKDGNVADSTVVDFSSIGNSIKFRKVFSLGSVPPNVDYSKPIQFTVALSRVDDEIIIRKFQMEKGNKVSDWKPSFSDLPTKSEVPKLIDNKVNNLESASTNLILNSLNRSIVSYKIENSVNKTGVKSEIWKTDKAQNYSGSGGTAQIFGYINTEKQSPYNYSRKNCDYVFSIYIKNNHKVNKLLISNNLGEGGQTVVIQPEEVKRVVIKGVGSGDKTLQFNFITEKIGDEFDFDYYGPMISEGTLVSAWSPAPEDLDDKSSVTSVNTRLDNLIFVGTDAQWNALNSDEQSKYILRGVPK